MHDNNSCSASLTIGPLEGAKERPVACRALVECYVREGTPCWFHARFTQSQDRQLERTPGNAEVGFQPTPPSQPWISPPPHHLSEHLATHTCCSLPNASFKEVGVPKKSKPLGLEATVALLSQLEESLCKESFYEKKGKEKGGCYDNRRAEQTISSPNTGKLVLKVTCFWTGTQSSVLSCHTAGALCIANWLI